jgi:deoxyribose-phosphate aldolase
MLTKNDFARMTEVVCIGNDVIYQDIVNLAAAAKENNFIMAYAPTCFAKYLAEFLKGSDIMVGAPVVGSDCGGDPTEIKIAMAKYFLALGCTELDMMINLMYLHSKMYDEVLEDIKKVREATSNVCLKVIIESPLLTQEEIKTACRLVMEGGADYVKTSTGTYGKTTIEQVKLIKTVIGDKIKIKAAGGIQGIDMINEMVSLGVSRFGMSYEKAVKILETLE